MFWNKPREPSTDYVELSIGRVDYAKLNWKDINETYKKSTIIKDVISNAHFLDEIEKRLVMLTPKQLDKLSVDDGLKMREKTKQILYRHGLLKENSKPQEVSTDDQSILDEQYRRIQETIKAARGNNGTHRHARS